MNIFCFLFSIIFFTMPLEAKKLQPVSTEPDPDAFIHGCGNVISGGYCEAVTDLIVDGPDALVWQRFHNSKNYITGEANYTWRAMPQRFLVVGSNNEMRSAYAGERSGGILSYKGKKGEPLIVDTSHRICNAYVSDMSGQTSHINRRLHYRKASCELTLDDGTRRFYKRVEHIATDILGEELVPLMGAELNNPQFYLLQTEILPSGNQIHFTYNEQGHLSRVELRNTLGKTLSWIQLLYRLSEVHCVIHITSSDGKRLDYEFIKSSDQFRLVHVTGSHCIPASYEYHKVSLKS